MDCAILHETSKQCCVVGCKTMQGTNHQAYEVQWGNIISCLLLGLPLLLHLIIIIAKKKLKKKKRKEL
jgi:hypothetical protein